MMESRVVVVAGTVAVTAVALLVLARWFTKPKNKKKIMRPEELEWQRMGRVARLIIYPVKSCRGNVVDSATTHPLGLVHGAARDRCFMISTPKGTLVSGRMIPSMVLISASHTPDTLTLSFPDHEDLVVDMNQVVKDGKSMASNIHGTGVEGLDCGEAACEWLERVLGRRCHLLYWPHPDPPRPSHPYMAFSHQFPLLDDKDNTVYGDALAYMLLSQESVDDLQSRVSRPVAAEDFRPNILVEDMTRPYQEDEWHYVRIGGAVFRNNKPCTRCIFTTVDHKTGKKDPNQEPLKTLKKYRMKTGLDSPCFGINLGLEVAGLVKEGDEVFVASM